jgi:hypothetical protein
MIIRRVGSPSGGSPDLAAGAAFDAIDAFSAYAAFVLGWPVLAAFGR